MSTHCCLVGTAGHERVRTGHSVAEVFRRHGEEFLRHHVLTSAQRKAMRDIGGCRTPALGGRVDRCDQCGQEVLLWNSCNNPHCPACGSMKRAAWLDARRNDLLPVGYFHVVFTLDHGVLPLFQKAPERACDLLFTTAASTLKTFAQQRGGLIGMTAVLHTWDQQLREHPHLHCLVPAGFLARDHSRWIPTDRKFLFSVKALSKVFKSRFLDRTRDLLASGQLPLPDSITPEDAQILLRRAYRVPWVVYCQPPKGGPDVVLRYLARYAYRVAISNQRILAVDEDSVSFSYKDRSRNDAPCIATLSGHEFIRRFLLHVLPKGFRRIRHFGFLANSLRPTLLRRCFELLTHKPPFHRPRKTARALMLELTGKDISVCSCCGKGTLHTVLHVQPLALRSGPCPARQIIWRDTS